VRGSFFVLPEVGLIATMRAFVFPVPLGATYEGLVAQSVEQRIDNTPRSGLLRCRLTCLGKLSLAEAKRPKPKSLHELQGDIQNLAW